MSNLIVKSNALIQASYVLSLVEQRIILMSIVQARESGQGITSESILVIRAMDYAELFDVAKHTAYEALADAVETLFNRQATVEVYDKYRDQSKPMKVRWVTAMAYNEGQGTVSLRFGQEVVPEITRLEKNFTSYELEQVAGLKSAYAVRLYELLIQWRSSGKTQIINLIDLRNQLGVSPNEYQRIERLKSSVLDLAISQINEHTDITVKYEQHKAGRVITGFSFKFKEKTKTVTQKETTKKSEEAQEAKKTTLETQIQANTTLTIQTLTREREKMNRVTVADETDSAVVINFVLTVKNNNDLTKLFERTAFLPKKFMVDGCAPWWILADRAEQAFKKDFKNENHALVGIDFL